MSDYYTLRGELSGDQYLLLVDPGRVTVYHSGFHLPWTGVSGVKYGLSYTPGGGTSFHHRWLWWADRRAKRYISRRERRLQREHTRRYSAELFVKKRRA